MNAQTLLLDSLHTRWENYKAGLKICRKDFSEKAVHDFRVAARRLFSSLDLLRAVMKDPSIQKMRRVLKGQLDDLDGLRDVQALLADMSEIIHETPVLQPFQEYLQNKEKKYLRTARKEIKSLKTAKFSKRIEKLNKTIEAFKQVDLDASLYSTVDKAYAIVNQRYALIDPDQPATIHHLRIAFKKFRYTIEAIYPLLQNFSPNYLKRLHEYQATMGDIQDMEVALHELANFSKIASTGYDPEPARSYYKERHALAISRYIKDKDKVTAFWRAAPDQPFPQEK